MQVQRPKNRLSQAMAILTLISAATVPATASGAGLDEFAWSNRPIVVFAASEDDPDARRQLAALERSAEALSERHVVVVSVWPDRVDGAGAADLDPSALREHYGIDNGEFAVLLIGKDTAVKRRSDETIDPVEFTDVIDTMPMRRREMRESTQ